MVNEQLLDYIKRQLGLGVTPTDIMNILISKGWKPKLIQEALTSLTPPAVSQEPKKKKIFSADV
jgi:hypothetical protein